MNPTLRLACALLLVSLCGSISPARAAERPNFIYIMADELGFFEPAFMGGQSIKTPRLDRMAAEGIRFKNLLAGSSVCAPTRCNFLSGKHTGHASVRSNGGGTALHADAVTIRSILKPLGNATGGFGKWGPGGRDSTGGPENHGFDPILGFYDQVHAHSYYPSYRIRNSEEIPLAGHRGGSDGRPCSIRRSSFAPVDSTTCRSRSLDFRRRRATPSLRRSSGEPEIRSTGRAVEPCISSP